MENLHRTGDERDQQQSDQGDGEHCREQGCVAERRHDQEDVINRKPDQHTEAN